MSPRHLALALAILALSACGQAPRRVVRFTQPKAESSMARHARALRLAARGRVQARAGLDAEASETLRLAYTIEPDLHVLVEHAEAAERAHAFGQAHAAWQEVLRHPLVPELQKRAAAEVTRLASLVPGHAAPILVHVTPAHARVVLERREDGQQRLVLSDGVVWLAEGHWQAASAAEGYKRELRGFRVTRGRSKTVAISLERGAGPVRLAGIRPGDLPPRTKVIRPKKPAPQTPERKPETKFAEGPATGPEVPPERQDPPEKPRPPEKPEPQKPEPKQVVESPSSGEDQPPSQVVAPQRGPVSGVHKWGPWAATGLGVVALGVGAYFGVNALSWAETANGLDPNRSDYDTQIAFYGDGARSRARAANGLFIAGGALAAAGTVWWILAPALSQRSGRVTEGSGLLPSSVQWTGRVASALWRF